METLILSEAKVIFFQEHKIRKKEMPRIRKRLREAGWAIHCGPCDETGKIASAGVGVMWREDEVKVYPEQIKDGELYKAYGCGMRGKYTMDVGWEKNYTVYNLYGKSGGIQGGDRHD